MKKSDVLAFAILGILADGPAHGYELRKRLAQSLGTLQSVSFGSLYPALQSLVRNGLITEHADEPRARRSARGSHRDAAPTRRSRITYDISEEGARRLQTLLSDSGPESWDDEGFRVHFAFFSRAERGARKRILEGRRMRLAERAALMRDSLTRGRERVDNYTLELQRHGLEGVERELRWLDDLIEAEHQSN